MVVGCYFHNLLLVLVYLGQKQSQLECDASHEVRTTLCLAADLFLYRPKWWHYCFHYPFFVWWVTSDNAESLGVEGNCAAVDSNYEEND